MSARVYVYRPLGGDQEGKETGPSIHRQFVFFCFCLRFSILFILSKLTQFVFPVNPSVREAYLAVVDGGPTLVQRWKERMSSITMIAKLSKADQTRMKESAGLGVKRELDQTGDCMLVAHVLCDKSCRDLDFAYT